MSTYHCDSLRKITISQLDPSMILGFYCRNSEDFEDFCQRVEKVFFFIIDFFKKILFECSIFPHKKILKM